jgi:hypothetical protein
MPPGRPVCSVLSIHTFSLFFCLVFLLLILSPLATSEPALHHSLSLLFSSFAILLPHRDRVAFRFPFGLTLPGKPWRLNQRQEFTVAYTYIHIHTYTHTHTPLVNPLTPSLTVGTRGPYQDAVAMKYATTPSGSPSGFMSMALLLLLLLGQATAAIGGSSLSQRRRQQQDTTLPQLGKRQNLECGPGIGSCDPGECCSESGFCGSTTAYCGGSGCQLDYSDSCDTL